MFPPCYYTSMNKSPDSRDEIKKKNSDLWKLVLADPQKARKMALEILADCPFPEEEAKANLSLGWTEILKGSYLEAEGPLKSSLEFFHSRGDLEGELKSLNALGYLSQQKEEYENAARYYSEILTKSSVADLPARRLAALVNLGELYILLQNSDDAASLFDEAMAIAETLEDNAEAVCACRLQQGILAYKNGRTAQAEAYLQEALTAAMMVDDKSEQAQILGYLGQCYLKSSNPGEAETLTHQALEIYGALESDAGRAETLLFLFLIHAAQKEEEKEKAVLDEAVLLADGLGNRVLLSQTLEQLSRWHERQGDFENALIFHKKHDFLQEQLHTQEISLRLRAMEVKNRLDEAEREADFFRKHSRDLEKANREFSIINEVGRDLTSQLSPQELSLQLYHQLNRLMTVELLTIGWYNPKKRCLEVLYPILDGEVIPSYDIPLGEGQSFSHLAFTGQTALRFDRGDEIFNSQEKMPPRTIPLPEASSYLFIPLKMHKRMAGILNLESRVDKAYTEYEEKIVTALAPFITVAVENAVTHEEINRRHQEALQEKRGLEKSITKISHLAHHDPLTQLPNRYMLEHILQQVLEGKDPAGKPSAAIAYLDLDGFKPVNDTLGHLAGDQVLRLVAERISGVIRGTDTVGRIGGDEFIFILGVADRPVVERICQSLIDILSQPFEVEGTAVTLGGSIGIALFPTDGTDGSALLRAADLAMYRAKKEGKNRFCFAEGPTLQAPL